MEFFYRAKTIDGKDVEGKKEAENKYALARILRAEGLTVISAEDQAKVKKSKDNFLVSGLFGRVKMKEKIIFASNLGSMIEAGLSLTRALDVMEKQSSNKTFKQVIHGISEKIATGESLSNALASYPKVFPEVFIAMVSTAEESGKLPEALKIVSEQMGKSYDLQRKIKGAMIYPAVIVCVIIAIGILMMIFLIPTLTSTFKEMNVSLPLSTQMVIGLSDFMVNNTILVVALILGFIALLFMAWKSRRGKLVMNAVILRLPVIGDLSRETNSAVVMRTVSSMIASGVSMIRTIEITERVVQNHYYKQVMKEALEKVQKGIALSTVFSAHQNLFPVFVGEMTAVGEETGRLPEMLLKGAVFYEDEVDQATKNLSTIIEPVLMVFIGIAVGFFAISMIGPMYSLSSAIK